MLKLERGIGSGVPPVDEIGDRRVVVLDAELRTPLYAELMKGTTNTDWIFGNPLETKKLKGVLGATLEN